MKYINQNSEEFGVTVQYATLGEYFQAVHQSDLIWEQRGSEDFLPYSTGENLRFAPYRRSGLDPFVLVSEPHQAWTGFYASRNVLKGVARRASSQLHAAETLFTRYRISFPDGPVAKDWALEKLRALRWAVSEVILQNLNTWNGNQTDNSSGVFRCNITMASLAQSLRKWQTCTCSI